jgi:hypothetical protein
MQKGPYLWYNRKDLEGPSMRSLALAINNRALAANFIAGLFFDFLAFAADALQLKTGQLESSACRWRACFRLSFWNFN